jgi:coenzyme F420-0:L-glutamate ligase / coenzyme F420-1:gamma-L-glutamate ligase
MVSSLILMPLTQIPLVRQGDSLPLLLLQAVAAEGIHWQDGDILVLAQKIVSKAEGRLVHLSTVLPSENAVQLAQKTGKDPRLVELILSESREVLRLRESLIIVEHRLGFVCANAV